MKIKLMLIPDEVWRGGRVQIPVVAPLSAIDFYQEVSKSILYQNVVWPLPQHRVYEIVTFYDTTYVFKLASEFAPRLREGEPNGG